MANGDRGNGGSEEIEPNLDISISTSAANSQGFGRGVGMR